MKYAQLVLGPAGSGKSTYCATMVRHGEAIQRKIEVVNLDPAAETFDYPVACDIRNLITLDDVMDDQDLHFGPNGGLVFAMEYLIENMEWLQDQLGEQDDDYILFDCPGQIELHTHFNIIKKLVRTLESLNYRVCGVFCLDSNFITDMSKFFSGLMVALSTMVNLEISFVNVLTKCDLLNRSAQKALSKFLEPDGNLLDEYGEASSTRWGKKYRKLTEAIAQIVDDFSMVKFFPLNINSEDSIGDVLLAVDFATQYGEDEEVKVRDSFDPPERDENMPPVDGDNGRIYGIS